MKFASPSRINALQGIKRIRVGSSSNHRNGRALSASTRYLSDISKSSRSQLDNGTTLKPHTFKFDESFDLVVVGSGCAGLTAAVVAGKHGLKVLVVEKTKYFGGTTAFSSGGIWIPNNHKQPELAINDDSFEKATTYIKDVLGDTYDKTKISQFLNKGPEMLKWVEENASLEFKPIPLCDYFPEKPGSSVARTLLPPAFDGRQLRGQATIKDIRYVLQGYSAFGSMQVDPFQLDILKSPFSSLSNLRTGVGLVSRHVIDLLLYGKGTSLHNGNALVGRLIKSGLDTKNVTFWKNSPALHMIIENGGIQGLTVGSEKSGSPRRIQARKGTILATGGFGRSTEIKDLNPHEWSAAPSGNVGNGIRLGLEAGGILPEKNRNNGIFAPMSILHHKNFLGQETGQIRRYPHFGIDRTKPGAIIVDSSGRRFANEAAPYQEFVKAMHQKNIKKAYFIGDRKFLRSYGMGMALPWPYPIWNVLRQGYLISAKTVRELAGKMGIPEEALVQTVKKANEMAETGVDPEFSKGSNAYDQFYGDPAAGLKNSNLGFCRDGPFYALPIYPGNVSTLYGLDTNENAQVLGQDGKPISKLYAVGLDQNHVFRGEYPGGGSSIGPGMTFGYVSAKHLIET
jgi:succinate dehydrogenase/fumarate reductase flavoprotein subunit